MTAPVATAPTRSLGDRVDGVQLALRFAVLLAGLAAVASIRLAATEPRPMLDLAIVLLVAVSVFLPDGHAGLVVISLVGLDWALAVDDPTTPWSMVTGAAIVAFHSSLALATIAPIGARPERPTIRRWSRRTAVVVTAVPPTWLAVVAVERLDVGASQLLVAAALLVVALVAIWSRRGDLT